MESVYLGIGSNLGDAQRRVGEAIDNISKLPGIKLQRNASLYGSRPFGPIEQNNFVNTVIEIGTDLEPVELLEKLKELEAQMGRVHATRWGPREIDLDILFFGDRRVSSAKLELPHPGIAERAFVLVPLAELQPDLALTNGSTVKQACDRLDKDLVWLLDDRRASSL